MLFSRITLAIFQLEISLLILEHDVGKWNEWFSRVVDHFVVANIPKPRERVVTQRRFWVLREFLSRLS